MLFTRKNAAVYQEEIKGFLGQNKEMRNAKARSANIAHYVLKIWTYCEHDCLFCNRKKIFCGFDPEIPRRWPTEIWYLLLSQRRYWGRMPSWLNVSKNFERSRRLDPKMQEYVKEYVILSAFPLQKYLYKRASMLRYTYFLWLVKDSHYIRYATIN